jgi:hypothetical protein
MYFGGFQREGETYQFLWQLPADRMEEVQAAWRDLRAELIGECQRKAPGMRPRAYWMFDTDWRDTCGGEWHPPRTPADEYAWLKVHGELVENEIEAYQKAVKKKASAAGKDERGNCFSIEVLVDVFRR